MSDEYSRHMEHERISWMMRAQRIEGALKSAHIRLFDAQYVGPDETIAVMSREINYLRSRIKEVEEPA